MKLLGLLILAITVEYLVNILKQIKSEGKLDFAQILAIAVGLLIAFTTQLDYFELIGMTAHIDYVGIVIAGLAISGGADNVHGLIDKLTEVE